MVINHYRLINSEGVDLGPFVTGIDDWHPGRIILQPSGDLEVVAIVDAEPDDNFRAYLVVKTISKDP